MAFRGLSFLLGSSGGGSWGSITGTLSNQTDLQNALNGKAATGANTDITSVLLNQTGLAVKGANANALTIKPNENLSAARVLSLIVNDANRSLTIAADATISGTNTGDQTDITGNAATVTTNANLTGPVTSTGNATAVANNAITLAMLAQMATASFMGRTTAGTGNVEVLTATQATAILNIFGADAGAGGVKGLVPATAAGDATKVLSGAATWVTNGGAPALTSTYVGYGASNVLSGDANFTWDSANIKLLLNQTAASTAPNMLQFTHGTQTGTTLTSGVVLGYTNANSSTFVFNTFGNSLAFRDGTAGFSSNRLLITSAATEFYSPDHSSGDFLMQDSDNRLKGLTFIGNSTSTAPTARLHLGAGTTSASTAPLKLGSGSLMTTAEVGAMEYNGAFYQTKVGPVRYGLGGVLTENFADVGNVTTAETDIFTYTTPANTFDTNGQTIETWYGGIFVNSTSTKQLKVYFGGTAIFDSTALVTSAASSWDIQVLLIRVSSTVVRATVSMTSTGVGTLAAAQYTEVTGLTLTNTNIVKITGTAAGAGAATNDIVGKIGRVKFSAS